MSNRKVCPACGKALTLSSKGKFEDAGNVFEYEIFECKLDGYAMVIPLHCREIRKKKDG